mmetsp:Transcript_26011/g.47834  ORF Transcript_26011/g.47834 Transcript_26011/m.47834 type:complete len:203 (+) Transcript_26011:114-722(+)|eukprot:CAMPEP_0202021656 /NCGR_PEP_ID=MMETSP0905-20130828/47473_1 /ASSEMBLY_ACC=CAM_ASM_000554 /TAXON_ID=420261 /ORGANISM="Thalassiosira antarctica, Strain CCMP982" /LENGTH=202 /DNA_ID=CAMNT_0048583593 /DNA_START=54 /DNA_END=665 /DNA_ORIENTATION=+
MPPHNLFDSDCEGVSMGQYFNSFLSSSINRLTPMCNDSAVDSAVVTPMSCNDSSGTTPMCNDSGPRVYSPTYPMNQQPSSAHATSGKSCTSPSKAHRNTSTHHHGSSSVATDPDPRRPPLNPIKPKTSHRNRKKVGLSINVPTPPSDPHNLPSFHDGDYHPHPPPISCSRNIELRRKSLSERHFFRPVSEDEESVMMGQQKQ